MDTEPIQLEFDFPYPDEPKPCEFCDGEGSVYDGWETLRCPECSDVG